MGDFVFIMIFYFDTLKIGCLFLIKNLIHAALDSFYDEVICMKGVVEERAVELGEYILQNKATVRAAAKRFHISKSTVHKDVSERLQVVNPWLYGQVRHVLELNKAQRHIRGGQATRRKYKGDQ